MINYPTAKANRNLSNFGATGGQNERDLAQRIGDDQVVLCQNYFPKGDGVMEAREGLKLIDAVDGKYSMESNLTSDIIVRAYDDGANSILETYTISTKTTSVKNTFSTRNDVCGIRYGDYFYACDGSSRIGFFHKTGKFIRYQDQGTYGTLTGGTGVNTTISAWTSISSGTFHVVVNGVGYDVSCDFTATPIPVDMDDIGSRIYNAMNSAGISIAVRQPFWQVDHFVFQSNPRGSEGDSEVSFLTSTGGGDDISGMMKCRVENGGTSVDGGDGQGIVGETVTGQESGAIGTIISIWDDSPDGKLLLEHENEVEFITGEIIKGSEDFEATASNTLYSFDSISGSPPASVLQLYNFAGGSALMAGDIYDGEIHKPEQVNWSRFEDVNTTGNFPFSDWTVAETQNTAGVFLNKTGGKLNDMVANGDQMFALYNDATSVFHLNTVNVDGIGLMQDRITDQQGNNFGGYKAISTPKGVFYTNENGVNVFTMASPTDVEVEITNILGEDKIKNLEFDDSDITWDGKTRIYVQCKKDGSHYNNFTLVYDIEKGIWTEITGWNIRRTTRLSTGNVNDLYGVDSVNGNMYKLFDGYTDAGVAIQGRILFREEDSGMPNWLKDLEDFTAQANLSAMSILRYKFNVWDKYNAKTETVKEYMWYGSSQNERMMHFGRLPMRNFLRYQLEISCLYEEAHTINFSIAKILPKKENRLYNVKERVIEPTFELDEGSLLELDDGSILTLTT